MKNLTDNEIADLLKEVNDETGRRNMLMFDHTKIFLRKLQEKYSQEWHYLTDAEIKEIIGSYGNEGGIGGYTRELFNKIEAKIREKNERTI